MLGIHGLVYTVALLTVSFFVLVVADKLKNGFLKSFGNVIALLLWALAALTLVTALYMAAQGYCPMMKMMGGKWGSKSHKMMQQMQK